MDTITTFPTDHVAKVSQISSRLFSRRGKVKTWIVRYYDSEDNEISSHEINNRNEHEAEHEAIADMPADCADWSLTEKS